MRKVTFVGEVMLKPAFISREVESNSEKTAGSCSFFIEDCGIRLMGFLSGLLNANNAFS